MNEFGYSYTGSRCAILFEINQSAASSPNYKFDSSETAFAEQITGHPLYSAQDIYGFISSDRYLVYKDTGTLPVSAAADFREYAAGIANAMRGRSGVTFSVGIGSVYTDLLQLRKSYLEALFLIGNYEYLNTGEAGALLIGDYLFEYLSALIPKSYWDNRFAQLSRQLADAPSLQETVIALTRNNQNLTRAAAQMGLHRNTLLQRFAKFKAVSGLNPLEHDYDRMVMRAFALHINRRTTLQAGIVIQPNSVLHQGMQKMADLVSRKSGGAISINIHTLSVSGNNEHLFELLRSGSIDMVVAATGVMNKFTNHRSKILEFPFLFESGAEANQILNTLIIDDLAPYLDTIGIKCLNIWSMGWRYLTSKEPVQLPQDMAGKKMRVMFTESLDEYFRAMGAIPIKMNYGDVLGALRSGIIDCQENPYSNILGMKFYKEQSFITHLKYYLSTEALYLSKHAWERLTMPQQELLRHAAAETTDWIFTEQQTVINQRCKQTLVGDKGMKIVSISPAETKIWKACAQDLYTGFPHQDLIRNIETARKEYHAKLRIDPALSDG